MYYHSEDFFNESLILSINDDNKFITLENGIIKKDNQPTNDINKKFIAMISLKSKEQFLFFYYDEKTGILIWKIKNKNFDNVNISHVKFPPVLVILDVFLNSLENHVFIRYQDINSSKHIININLVTEEINISKRDIDFEEIELISNNQENILYKFIRPGHGLSAKIIDVNTKNEMYIDQYFSFLENQIVYLHEEQQIRIIDIESLKIIKSINTKFPVISSQLLDKNTLFYLSTDGGIIYITIQSISDVKTIRKWSFKGSFELHNQVFDKIMFKYNSLSEGVSWGFIDVTGIHYIFHSTYPVNFIQTTFKKNEKSGAYILYKKRNTPPNKLLISLHGGPESFEFNENRYNGLYRELVYNDFAVCALNYPGSTFQKTKKNKHWNITVEGILNICSELSKKFNIDYQNISFLGVSFGATLSLLCASHSKKKFKNIVSVAPLMNLEKHIAKVSPAELNWFSNMFSNNEIKTIFNWENFYKNINSPVHLIQGDKDSIVDFAETCRAFSAALEIQKDWKLIIEQDGDHVPQNYYENKRRYVFLKSALLSPSTTKLD